MGNEPLEQLAAEHTNVPVGTLLDRLRSGDEDVPEPLRAGWGLAVPAQLPAAGDPFEGLS